MLFLALGGYVVNAYAGGEKQFKGRRFVAILHGIGLLISFVAGFGLLARLGMIGGWPLWVYFKIAIWCVLGLAPVIARRKPEWILPVGIAIVALGPVAAFLARYKPY